MSAPLLSAAETRDIVRLLQHLGATPVVFRARPADAQIELARPDGSRRHYPAILVARATGLGLVARTGTRLAATVAARSFLRRARAARDECFLEQHRDTVAATVEIDGASTPVRKNLSESPLSGLTRLKDKAGAAFLPAAALEAGERLLADFTRGQLQPRITASWEPRLSTRAKGAAGGSVDLNDSAMAARDRVSAAIDALGPELAGVTLDICCFQKGLETVERERQWPARSAKLMLRTALLVLARHYAPPPPRPARTRHWGADGFRPDW